MRLGGRRGRAWASSAGLIAALCAGVGASLLLGRASAGRLDTFGTAVVTVFKWPTTIHAPGNDGSGTVQSFPGGIVCIVTPPDTSLKGTCASQFVFPTGAAPTVVFVVTPDPGTEYGFNTNTIVTDSETTVVSMSPSGTNTVFLPIFRLVKEAGSVTRSGVGSGQVTSDPAGIACGATCTASIFEYGKTVTITATPDAGASFVQWTGACNGQGAVCVLNPKAAFSTNAVFGLASTSAASTASTSTAATTTTSTPATTSTVTTTTTRTVTTPSGGKRFTAQLIAAKIVRSKLGVRLIAVELILNGQATATVGASRGRATLAARGFDHVPSGDRLLLVPLSPAVTKGSAKLAVRVTGAGGAVKSFTATITIPAA